MTGVPAPPLAPAREPTIYFIGVTTGQSSILRIFPRWAAELKLGPCRIVGIDLPLHAPAEAYRRVVSFIKADPLSRGALVTTHKIDLFAACRDLFDEVDPLAKLDGRVELPLQGRRQARRLGQGPDQRRPCARGFPPGRSLRADRR